MLESQSYDTQVIDLMMEFLACPRQLELDDPVANAMYAVVAG